MSPISTENKEHIAGNTSSPEPLLLNVQEALALLSISRGLLYGFIREGRLPFVKIGNRTLFRRHDLKLFVDERVRTKSSA
jgi:excisionase family DNA binding protein